MRQVFIATSIDTRDQGEFISKELESRGLQTWLDSMDIKAEESWRDKLASALEESQDYLILIGPEHRRTEPQDFEWQVALENTWSHPEKRLIPVLFGSAEPPAFLRDRTAVRLQYDLSDGERLAALVSMLESETSPTGDPVPFSVNSDRQERLSELETAAKHLKED